jgi:hypothetical protein
LGLRALKRATSPEKKGDETEMYWLFALAPVATVLLAAVALIGLKARRAGCDLERSVQETNEIRSAVTALQTQMAKMKQSAADVQPAVKAWVPAAVLTSDQRAGALEMLRNGAAAGAVCGALRLSPAEASLLQKVQRLHGTASSPN